MLITLHGRTTVLLHIPRDQPTRQQRQRSQHLRDQIQPDPEAPRAADGTHICVLAEKVRCAPRDPYKKQRTRENHRDHEPLGQMLLRVPWLLAEICEYGSTKEDHNRQQQDQRAAGCEVPVVVELGGVGLVLGAAEPRGANGEEGNGAYDDEVEDDDELLFNSAGCGLVAEAEKIEASVDSGPDISILSLKQHTKRSRKEETRAGTQLTPHAEYHPRRLSRVTVQHC